MARDSTFNIDNIHAERDSVSRRTLLWMLIAQAITIAPLFLYLKFWVPIIWVVSLVWRIQIFRGAWAYPTSTIKFLLGLVSVALLIMSYAGNLGVEPMIAFFVLSFSLKLVEVRKKNDVILILMIGFFAITAQFLFSQSFVSSLYGIVSLLFVLSAWEAVFSTRTKRIKSQITSTSLSFIYALPLIVFLFVIVPRLNPLWNIPSNQGAAKTGFSESMSPGDVSQLVRSNELAFRVTFAEGKIPAPSERYWRGLVLELFDGVAWRAGNGNWYGSDVKSAIRPHPKWQYEASSEAQRYDYSIILEPHFQKWIFPLSVPSQITSSMAQIGFSDNTSTMTRTPVVSRIQYNGVSYDKYRIHAKPLSQSEYNRLTYSPKRLNPNTRRLAQQWRNEGALDDEIIQRALGLFKQEFTYSLEPPKLGVNSADDFLFNTKVGFCEHFSNSFVLLMRAAGIPARVVVGYQGGEYFENQNYLLVRQSDAHAWAEVWLPERGWFRVDPTAAVAPERIELGLNQALSQEENNLIQGAMFRKGAFSWVGKLQQYADFIDYRWTTFVLGYDSNMQSNVLHKLIGSITITKMIILVIGCFSGFFVIYYAISIYEKKPPISIEKQLYVTLIKKVHDFGVESEQGETPTQLLMKIKANSESVYSELLPIFSQYEAIAYGDKKELIAKFKTALAGLSIPSK